MDDRELLKGFIEDGSEDAFAQSTARYVDLVYSAAARQTADPEQARDVTQAVFVILARKAKELSSGTILSGWLYRTARFVALEAIRAETRRKRREETMAQNLDQDAAGSEDVWRLVAPNLDEAMEALSEPDRTAVLLRFFQGRSLREVGEAFAISEEAAKKRVSRALEKLRQVFGAKRNYEFEFAVKRGANSACHSMRALGGGGSGSGSLPAVERTAVAQRTNCGGVSVREGSGGDLVAGGKFQITRRVGEDSLALCGGQAAE